MTPKPLYSVAELDFQPHGSLHPSPADWRDQLIYFLMIDRFDDGRDRPAYAPGVTPTGRDPSQGDRFQGGTLAGVTRRLDYIAGLGCTAIWLSPFLQNRLDLDTTYHGYGAQNLLAVDPRFGSLADLQALTSAAHARGLYVIMDVVLNHTGDVWRYAGNDAWDGGARLPFGGFRVRDPGKGPQLDDAVWPIELQDPRCYKQRGRIIDWNDAEQVRDGDFCSLKELDINDPRVLNTLVKIYKHWLLVADIDGFRLDAVKHIESSAVAIFCNAIREYAKELGKQNFFIFGEIWADDATIQHYLGRNTRIEGTNERFPSLDAALDFPLAGAVRGVFERHANPSVLRERYQRLHNEYVDHGAAGEYFVTFEGNHDDEARLLHGAEHPTRAMLAMAYLLTSQGVPCIYYGTEQGFDGGGDADRFVREAMFGGEWGAFDTRGAHFFDPTHPLYQGIRAVAEVRRAQPALRYGRQYFREISGDGTGFGHPIDGDATLAYSRILDTDEVLIVLNLASHPRADWITVDAGLSPPGEAMRDLLRPSQTLAIERVLDRAAVRVPLPAHGLAILKRG